MTMTITQTIRFLESWMLAGVVSGGWRQSVMAAQVETNDVKTSDDGILILDITM